jgi:hypothetical protein
MGRGGGAVGASREQVRNASWISGLVVWMWLCKLVCAQQWDLLADEALYWQWSGALAAGYYDQPPGIAWVLAATSSAFGDAPLALRLAPLCCGLAIPLLLAPHSGDRGLWWLWTVAVPPLWWLTLFATPDAPLLCAWALGLAGALRGGPLGWAVAGLGAGLAFEAKHTGALLFPLLVLGARPSWRQWDVWAGGAIALCLAAPNLAWNMANDWVTLRFQVGEGLWHADSPGLWGPVSQLAGQLLVVTPVLAAVGGLWCVLSTPAVLRADSDRVLRVCWWTSAPLLAGFAVASVGAPPEAHWPAPAWIGVGLALSHTGGRWARATWMGLGIGMFATLLLVFHGFFGVLQLPTDPRVRLLEGRALSEVVAKWGLPVGVAAGHPRASEGLLVYTERYQEAALVAYHTGLPTQVMRGCGRPGGHLLSAQARRPNRAIFVRPHTSGPPDCVTRVYADISPARVIRVIDPSGMPLGQWDLFEVSEPQE